MGKEKLMFCPICGSIDVEKIANPPSLTQGSYYYQCKKCKFKHLMFPKAESESELKKIQKKLKKK